jgi:hypothetical protein
LAEKSAQVHFYHAKVIYDIDIDYSSIPIDVKIISNYIRNILEGAYHKREKYVPKNKTRKNPNNNRR